MIFICCQLWDLGFEFERLSLFECFTYFEHPKKKIPTIDIIDIYDYCILKFFSDFPIWHQFNQTINSDVFQRKKNIHKNFFK